MDLSCAVLEIGLAAGFDHGDVAVHDVVLCAGELVDRGAAGAVVVVRVADEQNLDVAEVEAEGLDALANQRQEDFEIAVDEDEALRRDDEVGGEVFAADVIEIAGDAEGRKGLVHAG